jgi:uncharacterized RDD family membrane protein YckC
VTDFYDEKPKNEEKAKYGDKPKRMAYASIWQRFGAYFIDGVVGNILGNIITIPIRIMTQVPNFDTTAEIMTEDTQQISLMVVFISLLVSVTLVAVIPAFWDGKTIGKAVLGIKVVCDDGSPVTLNMMLLREFIGKMMSSFLMLGYLVAFGDPEKRTWHDRIASTRVVKIT